MALGKKAKKPKGKEFVLDGSVTMAWFFKDEADPYADAVAAHFPGVQTVVHAIWPLEVANGVLMGERRKRSTEAQAVRWLGFVSSLPVTVDDETTGRAGADTLTLARLHNLSAYDAAYLELPLRRGLPLATLDDRLRAAAQAVGAPLYRR